MTRDEFGEAITLDTLRRFMLNSDLSDRRISRLMGLLVPFPGAGHLMMVTEPNKAADAITLCNVAT